MYGQFGGILRCRAQVQASRNVSDVSGTCRCIQHSTFLPISIFRSIIQYQCRSSIRAETQRPTEMINDLQCVIDNYDSEIVDLTEQLLKIAKPTR